MLRFILCFLCACLATATSALEVAPHAKAGKLLNLQAWLAIENHSDQAPDGSIGPATRQAISAYQQSIGLKPTGTMASDWESRLEKTILIRAQQILTEQKLYNGKADGLPGTQTKEAIRAFQTANQLTVNGELDARTALKLLTDSATAETAQEAAPEPQAPTDSAETTPAAKQSNINTGEDLTPPAIHIENFTIPRDANAYALGLQLRLALLGFEPVMDGKTIPTQAIAKFQETQQLEITSNVGPKTKAALEKETITTVQQHLYQLGLLKEVPTGNIGPKTRAAMRALQKERQLMQRDEISNKFLLALLQPDPAPATETEAIVEEGTADAAPEIVEESNTEAVESENVSRETSMTEAEASSETKLSTKPETFRVRRGGNESIFATQLRLALLGFYSSSIDGVGGKETEQAISAFQKTHRLEVTGIVGPQTQAALYRQAIRFVQSSLIQEGLLKAEPTGELGPQTRMALAEFQKKRNLPEVNQLTDDVLLAFLPFATAQAEQTQIASPAITSTETTKTPEVISVTEQEEPEMPEKTITPSLTPFKLPSIRVKAGGNEMLFAAQLRLALLGYYTTVVDGGKGKGTEQAIAAFQKAQNLSVTQTLGPQTNEALNRETITLVQKKLITEGLLQAEPTGTLGPKTRTALKEYQIQQKLPQTARITDATLMRMAGITGEQIQAVAAAAPAAPIYGTNTVRSVQQKLVQRGFLRAKQADGKLNAETTKGIRAYQKRYKLRQTGKIDQILLNQMAGDTISGVQRDLRRLGYKASKPNGKVDAATKQAIIAFQKKEKLKVTGNVDAVLTNRLASKIAALDKAAKTANTKQSATKVTAKSTRGKSNNVTTRSRTAGGTQINVTTRKVSPAYVGTPARSTPNLDSTGATEAAAGGAELTSSPGGTIKGNLNILRNSSGGISGCKVGNITTDAKWCQHAKENSSCSVLYVNGRVLSVRCG